MRSSKFFLLIAFNKFRNAKPIFGEFFFFECGCGHISDFVHSCQNSFLNDNHRKINDAWKELCPDLCSKMTSTGCGDPEVPNKIS